MTPELALATKAWADYDRRVQMRDWGHVLSLALCALWILWVQGHIPDLGRLTAWERLKTVLLFIPLFIPAGLIAWVNIVNVVTCSCCVSRWPDIAKPPCPRPSTQQK